MSRQNLQFSHIRTTKGINKQHEYKHNEMTTKRKLQYETTGTSNDSARENKPEKKVLRPVKNDSAEDNSDGVALEGNCSYCPDE
jgi:hypothetical protein